MSRVHPSARRSALLRRSFLRPYPEAVRGRGAWLWDADGRRYLDLAGSAAVNFIGHGVGEVAEAMARQARALEFVHSSQFVTRVAEDFAAEVLAFAGEHFRGGKVYFTGGGSEAVETALKLARQYQVETGHARRFRILSRWQSYHGATLGALAVSGNRRRRDIYVPMVRRPRQFEHVGLPYCYRCAYECGRCARSYADEVEQALEDSRSTTAAFIFEPVSGATLGAAVPPRGYLERVARMCRRRGVLLIADEVMTGFGRTGRNFAVEHFGVEPDILVAGKGIASGYAPLGAVIASRDVADAIARGSGAFVHGFTYNAHPVAMAAGRAVLSYMRRKRLVPAADSARGGSAAAAFARALDLLRQCRSVGDVRGIGLLRGVEFVAEKESKRPFPPKLDFAGRVAQAAARRGVLVYPMQGCVDGLRGDHLLLAPPAVITPQEIAWAVERLHAAIEEAEGN
ncbi:MAG TPA: aminotransferase class III-fold pyridoxal phosphate-dependent enzyme [Terriglobales bacterium]|nr:aminotransferase class III-fold pyridoxal phosphate-dependent enzyme [Terriglobales bacterium]